MRRSEIPPLHPPPSSDGRKIIQQFAATVIGSQATR